MNTLIYLASPYSHPLESIREERFQTACRAAAKMMSEGALVFSPVAHTHPIALAGGLPKGWDYWERYDHAMLAACGKVVVLMLPGWKQSKGVAAELEIATSMGLPIEYMEPI